MLDTLPTGGDTASHIFYAQQFCQYFPTSGLTQWLPEVFGGFPFLSYYFPLPFIVIFLFHQLLPFALAFKFAVFLPAIILPAFIYAISRDFLKLDRYASFFASLSSCAFLFHEQHSIWGGNLLSILAGEFAYSYGMLFSFLTLAVWIKALRGEYLWLLAGLLEAATGFSHGYALIITGFSSFFILLGGNVKQALLFLSLSHGLAFCLLAGWLWPLLEMHSLTIANDATFSSANWHNYAPKSLWPIFICGLLGLILFFNARFRVQLSTQTQTALIFLIAASGLAITFWLCAHKIGLSDIRFYPYVLLFCCIICGWLIGETFHYLSYSYRLLINIIVAILAAGLLSWYSANIEKIPLWSAWNHSGYENKPAWQQLSRLFPVLDGNLHSARLLFEHDPANNDLGSTRALEALPLFLHQRPVLEGLYMESALLAPVIYQLQSEVSKAPSSPQTRFPSGSLDIDSAARHMQLLHSNEVLTRSPESQTAIESSGLFTKIAKAPPFIVYRLKAFSSQLISTIDLPLLQLGTTNWMEHSFDWFKNYQSASYWPIYTDDNLQAEHLTTHHIVTLSDLKLERDNISFTTDQLGRPHLIKISYHPRWQLLSKGQTYLAAPGYIMLIPESNPVQLVYGQTLIGKIGMWVSLFTTAFIILIVVFKLGFFKASKKTAFVYFRALTIWCALLFLNASYHYYTNPERAYNLGWKLMNQQNYSAAASHFEQLIDQRRGRTLQEEVLFWAAKAHQLSGNRTAAMQRFQQLLNEYSGYWLPESIYTLAILHQQTGDLARAQQLRQQLKERYPRHRFTLALDQQ